MPDLKLVLCVCTEPDLTVWQAASLRKFLKQSFEFCVVDDSKDEYTSNAIRAMCEKEGFEYLRSPPHAPGRDQPSTRHADTLMYGWKNMRRGQYKYMGTIDNDFFLVSPLDLDVVLAEKNILTVKHTREHIQYFWPGCCIWRSDSHALEDFHWDICIDRGIRADTGGTTYYYWREHADTVKTLELLEYQFLHIPQEQWNGLFLRYLPTELLAFCAEDIKTASLWHVRWWCDIYADPEGRFVFFHLRDVSNWQGNQEGYLRTKLFRFFTHLKKLLEAPE